MLTLDQAAHSIGGTNHGSVAFTAVGTDSRAVTPGMLFVALKGERFDGHDYVREVLARGAAAALVTHAWAAENPGLPLLAAEDTRLALGRLAAAWRARFTVPLLGITGSNGKTSVKEMCAAILRLHHAGGSDSVLATQGNLNNDIGLPLTLLGLRATHRAAVIEMGMNHYGEIAYLTALARPTVAVVNNAQRAHLQGLGTLADVARAKGEIFAGLAADGVGVINGDDAQAGLWRELCGTRRLLAFGLNADSEVRGTWLGGGLGGRLDLLTPAGSARVDLQVPGAHNARNALAACAACLAADVPLATIAAALGAYSGVKGRLQRCTGQHGASVIDDTYNANPDSMRAAIDVLAGQPGRQLMVMGDMGEVGSAALQFHHELGGYARSRGIPQLFALGELSAAAVAAFGPGARHFAAMDDLVAALLPELNAQTTVLVKGSRFMRMERVVAAITENQSAA